MIGTGVAAQAAAYHVAGMRLRRIEQALALPSGLAGRLVLGYWLHASRDAGLSLTDHDDGRCMVDDCEGARVDYRLCQRHLSRFYKGLPAVPGQRRRVGRRPPRGSERIETCVVCGAQWCRLEDGRRQRRTCGSPECLTATRRRPKNAAQHAEILRRVLAGEPYAAIGANYGLTDRRISQLANRAGVFRRPPRGQVQRAARARRPGQ